MELFDVDVNVDVDESCCVLLEPASGISFCCIDSASLYIASSFVSPPAVGKFL